MMNKPDEKFSNNPIMSYDIYVVVFNFYLKIICRNQPFPADENFWAEKLD